MNIDPGVVTLVQATFLEKISSAFASGTGYAFKLLYLFTALELAVFGLMWAFKRELGLDRLLFKIIKIGLIFFVIQNYTRLINIILQSFAMLAGVVIRDSATNEYIFNPAKIWQYGYDVGVHLLQLATGSENFGLVMILISLGLGILLIFGLLGIQLVVQMVSFYLVSFGALILLPFGAFTPSRNLFDRAVQSVLQAGLRLMALTIIVGVAVVVWDNFQLVELKTTTDFNLNQPLGLFFTALLFLSLALYLPKVVGQIVGDLGSGWSESGATVISPEQTSSVVNVTTSEAGSSNLLAATLITPDLGSSGGHAHSGVAGSTAATTVPVTTATSSMGESKAKLTLAEASAMAKSISGQTVKKLKESIQQAMKETLK